MTLSDTRKLLKTMKKKINEDLGFEGIGYYDEMDNRSIFSFIPAWRTAGIYDSYCKNGKGTLTSDGSFDFVAKPYQRSQAKLIKKLAHGRASETKDGAILLTLKVYCDEGVNISETISKEAFEATEAIKEYQLKR